MEALAFEEKKKDYIKQKAEFLQQEENRYAV